ncbi:MAG: penicillin-binding protein 1B [Gammaproteobacteria bacterium]|nr:penicillin-binding protein 1B [Gammaproteobacteria bacterium]
MVWQMDRAITKAFEGRRWDVPAHVYAQPLELYEGRQLGIGELEAALVQLGYRKRAKADAPGTYARSRAAIELMSRPFRFWDEAQPALDAFVRFDNDRIASLQNAARRVSVPILRLDPLLVGSLFPGVVEDRLVTAPDEVPELLRVSLLVVEDRRFFDHFGIDIRGIARAAWVNIKTGQLRQGGSTLTQQLVKSYFLSNTRSLRRKFTEAIMAVLLERRYGKDELLNAYINEIYLGQDGARALHGFALASRYHFGRPLGELDISQVALLVAMVKGPGFYDPRRHPGRALERRNLVLAQLAQAGEISAETAAAEKKKGLGLASKPVRGASYYPAFMALVRNQLATDFDKADLAQAGLQVFTSLDPLAQLRAERALSEGIARLEKTVPPGLEGALVVTSVNGAEVLAAVGGRDPAFDGFNRVQNARRPIGSLIKPFVYLAGIESGRYHLASPVEDAPVSLPQESGEDWAPQNYDKQFEGMMPLVRALAESRNLPAVRLGMATGVERVVSVLNKFGLDKNVSPFPSVLLGAVEMTPFEVAQLYNTFANNGSKTPLNTVRFVLDEQSQPLNRYALKLSQVSNPADVVQINAGLLTAMRRGTGKSARSRLPVGLEVAGKTGTTDDLRDSWFAGFSGDRLAVVWVGRDDNAPAGLSGAAGALTIWADLFARLPNKSLALDIGGSLRATWINYQSGLESDPDCGDTVPVPVPQEISLVAERGCEPGNGRGIGERALEWLKGKIG